MRNDLLKTAPGINSIVVMAFVGAIASAIMIYAVTPGDRPSTVIPALPVGGLPTLIGDRPSPSQVSSSPSDAAGVPSPGATATNTPTATPSGRAPSLSPTRGTIPTPGPVQVIVTASYSVRANQSNGFTADILIRNEGAQTANWVVDMTFTPDVVITAGSVSNATVEHLGDSYRFRGTATVAPAQSVQFGFAATKNRSSSIPSRCIVNASPCEYQL